MKVCLVTTLPGLRENKRIEEELRSLGYEFELINLKNFEFKIDEKFESELNALQTDIIIVRGVVHSIKPIATILENLRRRGTKIFDNNFLNHKYAIDKVTDLTKLSLGGVLVPRTYYAREWEKFLGNGESLGFPVILKSTRSGKGASVFKLGSADELKQKITELESADKKAKSYILQEFIDYQYDLRCLIIGEKVFTMRRIPGEGEFRANFSLGGSVELFELGEEGKFLAIKALRAVDMTVGGVDILIDKSNNKYILEVNHTAGMLGMEKATGENITKIYVEHVIGKAR